METISESMKSRRHFLKLLSACAASFRLWPGIGPHINHAHAQAVPQGKPNVLMFVLDDMNDWIGCLGSHPDVKTPNIDRLAQRGVLFTNAQCSSPMCSPSRASFFTGIRPSTSGIYNNSQHFRRIMPDVVTLPQHFIAHGYRSMGCGKLYHFIKTDPRSWHEFFPSKSMERPFDPVPPNAPLSGLPDVNQFDWGPIDIVDEELGDGKLARWAADALRRRYDRPFFLGVGLLRPHIPLYVPRKYFDMYPPESITLPTVKVNDLDDVPPTGVSWAKSERHQLIVEHDQWRKAVAGYLASISFVDAQVGLVLDALDESPYVSNTVVVLWGDNGWHLGEKLHWTKLTLWEESCRVPLIIALPGLTPPGSKCAKPVSTMDVYPTLNELCDLTPKPELECRSILELLQNPQSDIWDGPPALSTYMPGNHSLRDERYRYIRYSDGTEELYDLKADPMEWNNLLAGGGTGPAGVRDRLAAFLPKFNAPQAPLVHRF